MSQFSREDTIPGKMKLDRQSIQTIKKIQRKLFRYSPNWGAMELYNINIKQKVNILSNIVIILNSHMKDIKKLLNSKQKVCFFRELSIPSESNSILYFVQSSLKTYFHVIVQILTRYYLRKKNSKFKDQMS